MPADTIYADQTYAGKVTFQQAPAVPAASFGDNQLGTTNPVACDKLQHQHDRCHSQANGVAAATERKIVHVAKAAGTVVLFEVGHTTAGAGGATLTHNLLKNGASVLSGGTALSDPVTNAAYVRTAGTIGTSAYVAGDVFEVQTTATVGGGTLPQGSFVHAAFRELP